PFNSVFFGHYIALSAVNDKVIPVWNRMDDGVSTLMGAIVDTGLVGLEKHITKPVAELISSPNPFQQSLFISFKIRHTTKVSLLLYNISGRLIQTIFENKEYLQGKYVEKIKANELNLNPGLYNIKLIAGNDQVTTKAVYIK
ncbi:MAG: T9SS type A sorting domain-containing protein, partial [Bacteroidales bacterium]|nr:T9SS type A sorting domain-containing protein [Bacteroidales bacterium]